jgi:hypothetical protein
MEEEVSRPPCPARCLYLQHRLVCRATRQASGHRPVTDVQLRTDRLTLAGWRRPVCSRHLVACAWHIARIYSARRDRKYITHIVQYIIQLLRIIHNTGCWILYYLGYSRSRSRRLLLLSAINISVVHRFPVE